MKIFSFLYKKTIQWSAHPHAPYYLAGVSFAESSFFPIPPDAMLISMGLAAPKKSWDYALITTLFSVLGGIFGYAIGYFGMSLIEPWLLASRYADGYLHVMHWFKQYGVWINLVASFSPVPPYKIFTIAAGAMNLAFLPFVIASFVGRGARFFLVSTLLYFMGERLHNKLSRYIDIIGWTALIIILLSVIYLKWLT
ncbi:YqaA family protein [Legionella dresdenensis]|uniref:YqaA family protein n=1 Tax=Legionella dresdenensis TaxID=450200 RepID=A0ABV8CH39_9GAMM